MGSLISIAPLKKKIQSFICLNFCTLHSAKQTLRTCYLKCNAWNQWLSLVIHTHKEKEIPVKLDQPPVQGSLEMPHDYGQIKHFKQESADKQMDGC